MFKSPSEIFVSIFNIDIYYYGLIMSIALLCGIFTANFIRKKYYKNISENDFFDIAFFIVIFGFIGARLYYCLFSYEYYSNHISEILNFRQGGLSIHGGIIFGLLAGLISTKIKKISFLKLSDIFSYGLILAQAIGRWGNFFNSEAFGKPTDIFCKLYIPPTHRPLEYINFEYFHPTFLYESILDILIFLILIILLKKKKFPDGIVFGIYLSLYSIARILVESLRIDSVLYIYSIPLPIIISAILLFTSIIYICTLYKINVK